MDDDLRRILERERRQIEQILELESEELQVEEVDGESSDEDANGRGNGEASASGEYTFNTSLASLHTYLGEVEDTRCRLAFLDGGATLNLPIIYLEGVVLFPEATLPLRVVQPNFIAAVERALVQANAPYTVGVVRMHSDSLYERVRFSTIGTTAEIRQFRRLEDGSLNIVARGQQRFRLRRSFINEEGATCGEVQIIQEDLPLRTPREVVGQLSPLKNLRTTNFSQRQTLHATHAKHHHYRDDSSDSDAVSEGSFASDLSSNERRLHDAVVDSFNGEESTSSDDDERARASRRSLLNEPDDDDRRSSGKRNANKCSLDRQVCKGIGWQTKSVSRMLHVQRAFLPHWVYCMYDSYCLSQKAADMWKQIIGAPNMDGFVKKPDLLSFHIGSKIPVSESTRQELLEIDGISYRLRREIELLESLDHIRCKTCRTGIARRRDMLVMSSDGPLGAYVNPGGHVHEVMTLLKAKGLALIGSPVKEYSWFPGYAWTIADCAMCERQLGWLFTAINEKLKPRSFWGIRSSQLADDLN